MSNKLKDLQESKNMLAAYKAKRLAAAGSASKEDGMSNEGAKTYSRWRVKSIADLVRVNTAAKEFSHVSREEKSALKQLKENIDVAIISAALFKKEVKETQAYNDLVAPSLKALGIGAGDNGYQWIPTDVSESYIDEFNLERKVASLFKEVKMTSNPFNFPVLSNGAIATILSQASAKGTPDQFNTAVVQFDAKKISNQYALPEELNEDSAVDMIKLIRQELIEGQDKAIEIAILEGDADGTHQHTNTGIPGQTGTPALDSPERLFDGLRKRAFGSALLKQSAGAAQINETVLSAARGKLGKFGTNPAQLALICGPKGYNQLLQLDDVRTIEQYGSQATVVSGELAKYEGMPVVVSEWLREDTDATGINGATALNNVKLSMIMVNRTRFMMGVRRGVQVKVESFRTQFDTLDMVSFSRQAFNGVLKADSSNAAAETSVVLIHDILA